jgi:hypothetical protein
MPDPQMPPWMSSPPPPPIPGGPVPPPGMPPPGWPGVPPPPRLGSGILVAIGVVNLIFSLFCGCVSVGWAESWWAVHASSAQTAQQVEQIRDWAHWWFEQGLQKNSSQVDEKQLARVRAYADSIMTPEAFEAAVAATDESPNTGLVRGASVIAAAAQTVLLVGSILLLLRKNAGRVLSMLACAAFIAATLTTAWKLPPVMHDATEAYAEKVVAGPAFKALPPEDQQTGQGALDQAPASVEHGVQVIGGIWIVWPAVSLLILLRSRSIREDCLRSSGLA